jgi:hypothetical protein
VQIARLAIADAAVKESAAEVQLEWGRPQQRKTSEHSSGGLSYKRQSGAAELTALRLGVRDV